MKPKHSSSQLVPQRAQLALELKRASLSLVPEVALSTYSAEQQDTISVSTTLEASAAVRNLLCLLVPVSPSVQQLDPSAPLPHLVPAPTVQPVVPQLPTFQSAHPLVPSKGKPVMMVTLHPSHVPGTSPCSQLDQPLYSQRKGNLYRRTRRWDLMYHKPEAGLTVSSQMLSSQPLSGSHYGSSRGNVASSLSSGTVSWPFLCVGGYPQLPDLALTMYTQCPCLDWGCLLTKLLQSPVPEPVLSIRKKS